MNLTTAQLAAVQSNHPLILCVSSAGSGKTRCLTERIKRLMADGMQPESIWACTYTVNAALEMESRIGVKLGHCNTLHSLCLSLLLKHGERIGFNPSTLTVLDEEASEQFIQRQGAIMKYKGSQDELRQALLAGIPEKARLTPAELLAGRIYHQLRRENMLTFDALLAYGLKLIEALPEIAWPQHLAVDEVQDASDSDWRIYEAILTPNKFYVGSAEQAIFQFRGGAVHNMLRLGERKDVELHYLRENFRSGQAICDVANKLADHMPDILKEPMVSAVEGKCVVTCTAFDTPDQEVLMITQALSSLMVAGGNEFALLCRSNALCDWYSDRLRGHGIKVAQPEKWVPPPDWPLAKLLVQLCQNPENDYVAHQWLVAIHGKIRADDLAATAAQHHQTINGYLLQLPVGMTVGELWSWMAQFEAGLAPGTILMLEQACQEVNPLSPVLSLAMHLQTYEGKETCDSGVQVMTYHKAKSREFDGVLIPACEQGITPLIRKGTSVDEERRAFYVACTRARRYLVFTWSKTRVNPWYGKERQCERSQFLTECGL